VLHESHTSSFHWRLTPLGHSRFNIWLAGSRFDGAGAGACVKRYTDPSIFMKIWADSELKKAEQEQQKARRERKEAKLHKKRLAIAGFHPKPRSLFLLLCCILQNVRLKLE
jgi:hypothetical protein